MVLQDNEVMKCSRIAGHTKARLRLIAVNLQYDQFACGLSLVMVNCVGAGPKQAQCWTTLGIVSASCIPQSERGKGVEGIHKCVVREWTIESKLGKTGDKDTKVLETVVIGREQQIGGIKRF